MENKLRENAFRTETQGEAERQKGNALLKDLQEKEQTLERETGGVLMRLAEKFADGMASKAAFIALLLSSHVLSTRLAGEALELPKDIPSLERPVAKEEQEVREMRERIVAFFEEIGIYKKLGYNVEVETGITGFNEKQDTLDASFELQDISREMIQEAESATQGGGKETDEARELRLRISKVTFYQSRDPLDALRYVYPMQKEMPIQMSEDRHIRITPFLIETKGVSPGQGVVMFYNWLKHGNPLILIKYVTLDSRNRILSGDAREIKKAIKEELRQLPEHQKFIDAIAPAAGLTEQKFTYEVIKEAKLSNEERTNLLDVFQKSFGGHIEIESIPQGGQADRAVKTGGLAKAITLRLDRSKIEKVEFSPLRVNGQIKEIKVERAVVITQRDDAAGTVNNEKAAETYIDKFGNLVVKFFRLFKGRNEGEKVLLIYPPVVFAKEGEERSDREEVKLDLFWLDLPDVSGLLFRSVEFPLDFLGDNKAYRVYSNMDHEKVNQDFGRYFSALEKGILGQEILFGLEKGEAVREVYIVNSEFPNAFFIANNPTTVVFQSKIFNEEERYEYVASHETLHLLDERFNLSEGELDALFVALKANEWFFNVITEKEFIPGVRIAGHPKENRKELLASFLNCLSYPQWEEVIARKSKPAQVLYLALLRNFQSKLKKTKVAQNAPIHKVIAEKINFLQGLKSE